MKESLWLGGGWKDMECAARINQMSQVHELSKGRQGMVSKKMSDYSYEQKKYMC